MQGKYLITTDSWFYAPDGKSYRAVWGEVEIVTDDILGIKTNKGSTNWFAKVGHADHHVIIAGCQIHYSVKCDKKPDAGEVQDYSDNKGDIQKYDRPTHIYIAN